MRNSKVFWGFITAAAAGALIGMLFAPEEGTKMRKKIKKRTNSLAGDLIEALEKSKQKASSSVDDLKEKGEEYKDEVKGKANDLADEAADRLKKAKY